MENIEIRFFLFAFITCDGKQNVEGGNPLLLSISQPHTSDVSLTFPINLSLLFPAFVSVFAKLFLFSEALNLIHRDDKINIHVTTARRSAFSADDELSE